MALCSAFSSTIISGCSCGREINGIHGSSGANNVSHANVFNGALMTSRNKKGLFCRENLRKEVGRGRGGDAKTLLFPLFPCSQAAALSIFLP